jgi:hypothetical protein
VSGQSIRAVNMRQLESVHIPQYLAVPIITHYVRKAAEGVGFVFEVENLPGLCTPPITSIATTR